LPKKIVLKIKQPGQQQERPEVEAPLSQKEEQAEPVVGEVVEPPPTEKPAVQQPPEPVDDALSEAMLRYEELMNEVEHIKQLDRNFMLYCIKMEELRPQLIRSILSRLAEKRNALLSKVDAVMEKIREARDTLGSEFAETEEELIWASIELNTMQLEQAKKGVKDVGLKEELEARIPELRKRLTTLRNRLKSLEEILRRLSELPKNVVELTSSREEAEKLFEDAKKRLMLTHGARAEAVLRAEVERIAQQESIPRDYAVLLFWKSLAR
jgi:chromosome segregation ATPase